MKEEIYKCDGHACGKVKGAANHWYGLTLLDSGGNFMVASFDLMLELEKTEHREWEYFCGSECLLKAISGLLK